MKRFLKLDTIFAIKNVGHSLLNIYTLQSCNTTENLEIQIRYVLKYLQLIINYLLQDAQLVYTHK